MRRRWSSGPYGGDRDGRSTTGSVAVVSALDTQHRRWHIALTVGMGLLIVLNLMLIIAPTAPSPAPPLSATPPTARASLPPALACDT